ncbi:MAG: hypothetical protein WDN47_05420 [Candidatus Doudnabacteria bacterium]
MARLETEINQIYLTDPESKKSSLILYEEEISNSAHLFVLAELKNLLRKSEAQDLKKISEIILESFHANKKLAAETLFESALAQVNQNLADLAHSGHKSWVGKFSCLIALKSGENIYIANDGQTSAWLLRKSELLEILKSEKHGIHPLKTFTNFTQGRLKEGDGVIITTSNIFNFISVELFSKILANKPLGEAANEISKILQDSQSSEEGFSSFFLSFGKKTAVEAKPAQERANSIYAPMQEENEEQNKSSWAMPALPKLQKPRFSLPKMPRLQLGFFQNLSTSGKFFFISFSIFLLLFLGNLGVYAIKAHGKKSQSNIDVLAQNLANDMSDAQSALIYKNDKEAFQSLAQAESDFTALQKLSASKADGLSGELQKLKDQVNKVSTIADPKVFVELKHSPVYVSRASIGFLFANKDSNSLSLYDSSLNDYFLLNSLKSDITGINYFNPAGVVVTSGDSIYHIDPTLKQFEPIVTTPSSAFIGLATFGSNLYTLNPAAGQVIKTNFTKNKYSSVGISTGSQENIRDLGADKDIYLLFTDKIEKITNNKAQSFPYPALSDPITNATKIFVGSNLYILEANKKRVVILNKNGQLLNQIYLPTLDKLFDLAVDESSRSLYILGDNKLYKITL